MLTIKLLFFISQVLFFVSPALLATNITIRTKNQGIVDSRSAKVSNIYTNLTSYGIVPLKYKFLKFFVKACHNVFVLLSTRDDLNSDDFYEIIIGSGNPRKIRLRRKTGLLNEKKHVKAELLSCTEFRPIKISWSEQGRITVGTDSKTNLEWKDSSPIPVNGFGIMTAWGSTGTWLFEVCPCTCEYKEKLKYWSKQKTPKHTREEWLEILKPKLEELKRNLAVDKRMLSSSKRRRRSARDNRKSSEKIGFVGVFVLTIVTFLIVLIDLTAIRDGVRSAMCIS